MLNSHTHTHSLKGVCVKVVSGESENDTPVGQWLQKLPGENSSLMGRTPLSAEDAFGYLYVCVHACVCV